MEENTNISENIKEIEECYVPKNTKQQNILYTIISIALFCLIYFGGKGIIGIINQPYNMYRYVDNATNEIIELQYEYAYISQEHGAKYIYSQLEKNDSGYKVSILFSGIENIDEFVDNGILFEFGNAIEDTDNEFYPYSGNSDISEYVSAVKYVDNDNPNNEILIFEYDGQIYAEFQSYGVIIPTEVKILFDGCEKVY